MPIPRRWPLTLRREAGLCFGWFGFSSRLFFKIEKSAKPAGRLGVFFSFRAVKSPPPSGAAWADTYVITCPANWRLHPSPAFQGNAVLAHERVVAHRSLCLGPAALETFPERGSLRTPLARRRRCSRSSLSGEGTARPRYRLYPHQRTVRVYAMAL